MAIKIKSIDTFLRCNFFGASLASPIIGAGIGFYVGGIAGAAIGLVAGPASVVGLVSAYYVTGVAVIGVKKILANRKAGKPLNLKKKLSPNSLRRVGRKIIASLVRGLDWATNMALGVCTLGKVQVNLHGLAEVIEGRCNMHYPQKTQEKIVSPRASNTAVSPKCIGDEFDKSRKHEPKKVVNINQKLKKKM